jgi:hypothetical protein
MTKVTRVEVDLAVAKALANINDQDLLASAVRVSLDWLATQHPGRSVEVRVPPYRVVQILEGTTHRRGTPPAVVEMSPETWLKLFTNQLKWADGVSQGAIIASGDRSDLSEIFQQLS